MQEAESKRYYAKILLKNNFGYAAEEINCFEYFRDFTKCIEDREYIRILAKALSEGERQLYLLHYYYGLSFKEISERLELNYNTIRSMHVRGMAKMRKRLREEARYAENGTAV